MKLLTYTVSSACLGQAIAAWAPITAISWAPLQISVFFSTNESLWRKYYTAISGWEPFKGRFEPISRNVDDAVLSQPVSVSMNKDHGDVFIYDDTGHTWHKYWDGTSWHPRDAEQLAASSGPLNFTGKLSAASWGPDRIDVVGTVDSDKSDLGLGDYVHLYWDGHKWTGWEDWTEKDFEFSSPASIVSWGADRFDVFGVDADQSVRHKYWDGYQYTNGWEILDQSTCDGDQSDCDPPDGFKPESITASSWGPGRWDVWAVGNDAQLWHTHWDGNNTQPREPLGGSFEAAPQVIHWSEGRVDIVGFGGVEGDSYWYKYGYWDGSKWHWVPSAVGWIGKHIDGGFASEPVLTSWGKGNLNIVGVDSMGSLRWQMWNETGWYPGENKWEHLGSISKPNGDVEDGSKLQRPLLNLGEGDFKQDI